MIAPTETPDASRMTRPGRPLLLFGLPLVGWSGAVVAVRLGPAPVSRKAATFLVGSAFGLLATDLWSVAPRFAARCWPF